MKPLLDPQGFMKRFQNFEDGELREINVLSPTTFSITLAGQDEARGFDWVSVTLEFSNVQEAKLLENNQLRFLDMHEGLSIIKKENLYGFAHANCKTIQEIKNASLFVISSTVKYEEGAF